MNRLIVLTLVSAALALGCATERSSTRTAEPAEDVDTGAENREDLRDTTDADLQDRLEGMTDQSVREDMQELDDADVREGAAETRENIQQESTDVEQDLRREGREVREEVESSPTTKKLKEDADKAKREGQELGDELDANPHNDATDSELE